ncbi:hypothetical protein F5141DRAFT_1062480 [Pisolithus sp. B1]|nr:hypothetical protein F5141DRAFT_1062480 [Pisolithus sp. B1]
METAINQSHFGLHCRPASSEGCGQTRGAPISIQPLLLHKAEQIIRKILPIAVTIEDGRPGTDSEDNEGKTIEVARQPLNGNPEARNLLKWGNGGVRTCEWILGKVGMNTRLSAMPTTTHPRRSQDCKETKMRYRYYPIGVLHTTQGLSWPTGKPPTIPASMEGRHGQIFVLPSTMIVVHIWSYARRERFAQRRGCRYGVFAITDGGYEIDGIYVGY